MQPFCRICLKETRTVQVHKPNHDIKKENLHEYLRKITNISTDGPKSDSYPTGICHSCFVKMIALDSFREKCIFNMGVVKLALLEDLKEDSIFRLKTFCRFCLKQRGETVDAGENPELLACIEEFLKNDNEESQEILSAKDSRLPRSVCRNCNSKLNTFMAFRALAKRSEEYFKSPRTTIEKEEKAEAEVINEPRKEQEVEIARSFEIVACEEESSRRSDPSPSDSDSEEAKPINRVESVEVEASDLDEPFIPNPADSKDNENPLADLDSGKPNPRRSKMELKCRKCGRRFAKQITLDGHVKSTHEGVAKPFVCDKCGRAFRQYSSFTRHQFLVHTPKPPPADVDLFGPEEPDKHVCWICLKQFKRRDILKQHVNTAHIDTDHRPFKCKICQKGFGYKKILIRHELNHSDARPFHCNFCPKRYNSKVELATHTQRHIIPPELLCPICKCGKSTPEELQQHIARHQASRQHQCPKCGKVFTKKFHLREHENAVHLKLRPFKCSFCSKSFGTTRARREHESLHDPKTRPVLCAVCNMNFKSESTLSRHMAREHGQPPKKPRAKNKLKPRKTAS